MPAVEELRGLEILDSRGRPTVRTSCVLAGGACGVASVPSGASRGGAEAVELRDGDPSRYGGFGCRRAVEKIEGEILRALHRRNFDDQRQLDEALCALDGTAEKSRLGANAVLSVSLAFARAVARERGVELHDHFADLAALPRPARLPRPTINLFSGGKHAGGQVPIQDVLVVPTGRTIDHVLSAAAAVYGAAIDLCRRKYGARPLAADEGGLAPAFADAEAMLGDAIEAISAARLRPGRDVCLAVDVAATHFFEDGLYRVSDGETLDSAAMVDRLARWVERYPLVSVEDGLAEEDWTAWSALRCRVAGRALVVGDDLLCTNPTRIRRAVESAAADTLLLKVNQIGTLSEAADALRIARSAGWQVTISARSGETEDDWLADLAVGWGGDQIKIGSITRSERLAKYNRLLAIEAARRCPVVDWPLVGQCAP